jgi:hypothetical protein
MHLFTWEELRTMFVRHDCEILAASASNFLSTGDPEAAEWFTREPHRWERFLDWETRASEAHGAIDGGTQIVAAVRRP